MTALFGLLGGLCCLAGFAAGIIILISAFQDEIWKGIVSLLCGLYFLYYGIAEFQHPKKGLILACWLGGGLVGGVLINMAGLGTRH